MRLKRLLPTLGIAAALLLAIGSSAAAAPRVSQASTQGVPACGDPNNLCLTHAALDRFEISHNYHSPNFAAQLICQSDGNLVVYDITSHPVWATGTNGRGFSCRFQGDGNLVVYDFFGNPLWASGTWGHPSSYLVVQGDGNVVIYDPGDVVLWAL
jgi:hypothetical protein